MQLVQAADYESFNQLASLTKPLVVCCYHQIEDPFFMSGLFKYVGIKLFIHRCLMFIGWIYLEMRRL